MKSFETIIDGTHVELTSELIAKYDLSLPRYTSYPTAPVWRDDIGASEYAEALTHLKGTQSLYVHLPFCAERCTFCACNVVITKRREVVDPYLASLQQEMELITRSSGNERQLVVDQLHLGGGTPTYLNSDEMKRLMDMIRQHFSFTDQAEISIEADPRWVNEEKMGTLRELGFNRISFGVQDVDPQVQHAINRIQPMELVQRQIEMARSVGFRGINTDLIYGLPLQTASSWKKTLEAVKALNPDRIALFSFAHVPWLHAHHRTIELSTLPTPPQKISFFLEAIEQFGNFGYEFIGMDHFAKPEDELSIAKKQRQLHRNFQGYTTKEGLDLIGMGVSAIGKVGGTFLQNDRKLASYQRRIMQGELATTKGWRLTEEDQRRHWVISRLFCHQRVLKQEFQEAWQENFDIHFARELHELESFQKDGLVSCDNHEIAVTPLGRLFIRNIGAVFDAYLKTGEGKFSKAV
ncbi:MAG: oxygen-independent coproporphyrinogen III oxidase [Deltaproteobacteria bacterium RIFCSPLOWO2_02_FULL_44_10]|nr:MAG: oxygen-independent coproporphyrinogen III oxidase [Deltaproteobacteria bacterium RIFCSPHIGHO2_02_FULL_44_16]OGQ47245.1 MAG: oxygen-independent coproporphyrinogen III oxidase [Deltaproteobacteria bacterium RIFCSPLOWO2_02_FULL_44_10]